MVGNEEAADEVLVAVLFFCGEVTFCDLPVKEAVAVAVALVSWLLTVVSGVSIVAGGVCG